VAHRADEVLVANNVRFLMSAYLLQPPDERVRSGSRIAGACSSGPGEERTKHWVPALYREVAVYS
jgi:hypothetical protein